MHASHLLALILFCTLVRLLRLLYHSFTSKQTAVHAWMSVFSHVCVCLFVSVCLHDCMICVGCVLLCVFLCTYLSCFISLHGKDLGTKLK